MNDTPTFISIYDNSLQENQCTQIINEFENDKDKQVKGFVGNKEGKPIVKPNVKLSTDVNHYLNDGTETTRIICNSLKFNIERYKKEHPTTNFVLRTWSCSKEYNIQRYKPGEGFFKDHCEVDDLPSAHRVLVWMFYLNSLDDGGTLFPLYNIGIKAVQGRLVIWPAYWTHLHRGQVSQTKTKYIATGWYSFS